MSPTTSARPGLVLGLVVTTQLMIVLDNTVVILALPSIQADFGASASGLAWISNGYILAFGGLLLLGGRLGDVLGRRRVLLSGITLFTVASLIGGAAPTEAVLITARIVQGVGAAMAAPSGLAMLLATFAEGTSRNKALGVFFAMSAAGGACGLLAGGLLTSALSWSWVLWINVPLGLAIVAAGPRVLAETARTPSRFDVLGTATSTIGVTALIFGLIHAGESGWSDVVGMLAFLTAAVLLPAFVVVQRWVEQPLLPLRLFERRATAGAYAAMLLVPAVMVSMAFFTAQYMQIVLGYTAFEAGIAFLPMSMIIFLASRTVPGLVARFGPRRFPIAGAVLLLAALAWLSQLSVSSAYLLGLAPALVLIGLGGGLLYMPLSAVLLGGVRSEDAGAASGAMQAVQQIGGALGIAVLVSVFSASSRGTGDVVTPVVFADAVTDAYVAGLGLAALVLVFVLLATRPERSSPPASTAPAVRGAASSSHYERTTMAEHHAASTTGPASRRTFVLIPGVGHGGWAWHPVAQRLRDAGHGALTTTLPGTADGDDAAGMSTENAVAHVVEQVRRRGFRNVVLVAHSWGGYPATAAAHRLSGLVEAVVYVSAVVPRRGVSMTDELPPEAAAGVRAAASRDGTVSIPFEAFAQSFMQDEPETAQRLVFDLLTPTPRGYLLEGVDVGPVTDAGVPAAYVLAVDDLALARPGREFAARLGLEPIMVPGSHEALLTHPDDVARAVLAATEVAYLNTPAAANH